jgi:hypothetical protein
MSRTRRHVKALYSSSSSPDSSTTSPGLEPDEPRCHDGPRTCESMLPHPAALHSTLTRASQQIFSRAPSRAWVKRLATRDKRSFAADAKHTRAESRAVNMFVDHRSRNPPLRDSLLQELVPPLQKVPHHHHRILSRRYVPHNGPKTIVYPPNAREQFSVCFPGPRTMVWGFLNG